MNEVWFVPHLIDTGPSHGWEAHFAEVVNGLVTQIVLTDPAQINASTHHILGQTRKRRQGRRHGAGAIHKHMLIRIKKNAVRNKQQSNAERIIGLWRDDHLSLPHVNSASHYLCPFYFRIWLLYFYNPHVTRNGERS